MPRGLETCFEFTSNAIFLPKLVFSPFMHLLPTLPTRHEKDRPGPNNYSSCSEDCLFRRANWLICVKSFLTAAEPSITVRKHSIILSTHEIKAVILFDRCFIVVHMCFFFHIYVYSAGCSMYSAACILQVPEGADSILSVIKDRS